MNLIVQIYMIVCVVLLIFDVMFLLYKNITQHRFYPKSTAFEAKIRDEIALRQKTGAFSEEFLNSLEKKLKKTKNLITLQNILEEQPEAREWFHNAILGLLANYEKKSDYEQAYYTYVVSTLDYSKMKTHGDFTSRFLHFLDSKSLYTFINTMNALYQFGDVNLLMTAIDKIDKGELFYHKKLFVDGLLASTADQDELCKRLLEVFPRYTSYTQDCLLDYFRLVGYDVSKLCLHLIQDDTVDQELCYNAMRYFVRFSNEEAKVVFVGILESDQDDWVKQMHAIKALGHYDDESIRALIKSKITSRNWHVRTQAADYLHKHGLSESEMQEIAQMNDKYAQETLQYLYEKGGNA